ncbi:unnamed protein product [Polarella glacialis]|uniref:Lipid desaturase domain-containing protein n=2 Tax=Polarella glacialis TaxID=89957 RepID=A0A813FMC1_POLGL|nr:unnamed protein product [Polarella glacialis]CAE8681912.1 unnamed protein product [Polarella glacialis]CAE8685012.1 unnamed protein product [Polarella glacialis]|mmetsp:Transcript_43085/g.69584  ORF Transcript_43085/g.69584 Transcript_43085/m.69584 type:complete len:274 (+) Transcript_43085:111-932(+)
MASDLLSRTMVSDGVKELTNWTVATMTVDPTKAIVSQMPHETVLCMMLVSVALVAYRCKLRDAWVLVAAYVMADLYMAVLHMWLDHPITRDCSLDFFKERALIFQRHHLKPAEVLTENHVRSIDNLNLMTLATPMVWMLGAKLLAGRSLPRQLNLFALATACFGILAAYNHVCMHARTHHVAVPSVIEWGQDAGLLPHNEFHRTHHTPPHDRNFSFLNGGAPLYDFAYLQLQGYLENYYVVMTVLFGLVQPMTGMSLVAIAALLRSAPKVKSA